MSDREMKYKMVICYRKDLKLSKGKLAVQVAHGAVSCSLQAKKRSRRLFSNWYEEGQRKVVVKVEGRSEIFQIYEQAQAAGIISSVVVDAGLTQIPPGTPTCVCVGPDVEDKLDKLTGEYTLG